jgi:beta-glucosidase
LLRKEWGFTGMLTSDFEDIYTEVESVKVGLNLEMPGISSLRADRLVESVEARLLSLAEVDMNARHVIDLASKV